MAESPRHVITLIGLGTIGISFAALHLKHSDAVLRVYDPRPDLEQHVASVLPIYLGDSLPPSFFISNGRLTLCSTLEEACTGASIVQEQGPENAQAKSATWSRVLDAVSPTTHLWSSTSGVPASVQIQGLDDRARGRLLVVHPFNPPHIMPLIEVVPSPHTQPSEVQFARDYFTALNSGHRPVVIRKELPGFVANRLAFILFREACSLVADDVVDVQDLDTIVEASLGPRWAVTGPFKSYNYGGGAGGLPAFLKNLSGTMEQIWQGAGTATLQGTDYDPAAAEVGASSLEGPASQWTAKVVQQTLDAYGRPDASGLNSRDVALQEVLKTIRNLQQRP
jgi:3-hydroxyacyl-CoA dehydrogenase